MLRKIVAGVICFLCFHYGFCQTDNWFIKTSLLKESFFYPSVTNFTKPLHPGFSVGIEKQISSTTNWSTHYTGDVGFYHHKYFQNGLFVMAGHGWGYQLLNKLTISASGVIGYLHTFRPTEVYELQNGSYVKAKNFGKPNALIGINLAMSYALGHTEKYHLQLDYGSMVNGPFNVSYGAPVVPITFARFGIKIKVGT